MNKAISVAFLSVVLLLSACATTPSSNRDARANLPDTPEGYRWYTAGNGAGTFLVPSGWNTREQTQANTDVVFITRESIDVQGSFEVGITINRVRDFSDGTAVPPSEYAKSFIDQLLVQHDALLADTIETDGDTRYIARVQLASAPNTRVHYIAVGRSEADELYLVYFEAPESQWDDTYTIAQPVLDNLRLGNR